MAYGKAKWLIYTVLVGLIPFMARSFVYLSLKDKDVYLLFHEADFVVFGLVLHITNINELEHYESDEKPWKTIQNGISIIFIPFMPSYLAFLALARRIRSFLKRGS